MVCKVRDVIHFSPFCCLQVSVAVCFFFFSFFSFFPADLVGSAIVILAFFADGRTLPAEDFAFLNCVSFDIAEFERQTATDSALVLPPVSSYHRFLIHNTVERNFPELSTLSIGKDDERRIVVYWKNHEHMSSECETKHDRMEACVADHATAKSRTRRPDKQLYIPRARRTTTKEQEHADELPAQQCHGVEVVSNNPEEVRILAGGGGDGDGVTTRVDATNQPARKNQRNSTTLDCRSDDTINAIVLNVGDSRQQQNDGEAKKLKKKIRTKSNKSGSVAKESTSNKCGVTPKEQNCVVAVGTAQATETADQQVAVDKPSVELNDGSCSANNDVVFDCVPTDAVNKRVASAVELETGLKSKPPDQLAEIATPSESEDKVPDATKDALDSIGAVIVQTCDSDSPCNEGADPRGFSEFHAPDSSESGRVLTCELLSPPTDTIYGGDCSSDTDVVSDVGEGDWQDASDEMYCLLNDVQSPEPTEETTTTCVQTTPVKVGVLYESDDACCNQPDSDGTNSPAGSVNSGDNCSAKLNETVPDRGGSSSSGSATEMCVSVDSSEESWEHMYDDTGECLNPELMQELTVAIGKVKVRKPKKPKKIDYYKLKARDICISDSEFGHVIEVYDFPAEFKTHDLMTAFSDFQSRGFDIKWVDDTHALGLFSSPIAAAEALSICNPMMKTRPLSQATRDAKLKAKHCAEFLQPYKPRPETSASLARRLVSGALGLKVNIPKEQRESERQKLKEAKEKRKLARQKKDDAWEGTMESTNPVT